MSYALYCNCNALQVPVLEIALYPLHWLQFLMVINFIFWKQRLFGINYAFWKTNKIFLNFFKLQNCKFLFPEQKANFSEKSG